MQQVGIAVGSHQQEQGIEQCQFGIQPLIQQSEVMRQAWLITSG